MPPLGVTSGSSEAVDHERRYPHAAQVPRAVGAGGDGDRLAGRAVGAEASGGNASSPISLASSASKCGPEISRNIVHAVVDALSACAP